MTKYILAAAEHALIGDDQDRLMTREAAKRLEQEIGSIITDNSLILCEGFESPVLLTPGHPTYKILRDSFLDLPQGIQPTIGGFDLRHRMTREENRRYMERGEKWERIVRSLVLTDWTVRIDSLEECITKLKTGILPAEFVRSPTSEETETARMMGALNRRFDRAYLEAMKKHGRRFDACIFIGGALHVVAMALTSGYEIVDLTQKGDATNIYYGYLADYHWSRLFLSQRSRR